MIIRKMLSVLTVIAVSLTVGSCATKVKNQEIMSEIRISWWGTDYRNKYTIEGVKKFEDDNGIICHPEYGEFSGFKERMDVDFLSGTEADVMQLNYDWLNEYSPDGEGLYDLNQLSDYINLDNFSQEDLSYGEINGKLNGIPISMNAITFYYNKSLYDNYGLELPDTWDDLFSAAQIMKTDEVYPVEMGRKACWLCCVAYYEQASGKAMFNEKGQFCYDKNDLKQMLEFYQRLINEKVMQDPDNYDSSDMENCRTGGVAAWISDANNCCSAAEKAGYNIKLGNYPTINPSDYSGWYKKPMAFYSIKKNTENPEAAAKLVDYLLNGEDMAVIQKTEKGVPVSKSALEVLEARDLLSGIELSATRKMNNCRLMELMSPYLENSELINAFFDRCDDISYEMRDSEYAAKLLYENIEAIDSLPKTQLN